MEKSPQAVVWPGYEGYPTLLCTYYVTDSTGSYAHQQKTAKVVLLDPPTSMIARWAVNALIDVTGDATLSQGNNIMQTVLYASGGQFAVSGMVYEDMDGTGAYTLYCFRDGLTCNLDNFINNNPAPLTSAQISAALNNVPIYAYSYARIISSDRAMYTNNGGAQDVSGLNFLPVVRAAFKSAYDTGHNELFAGWVRSNYHPNQNPPAGKFPYVDYFPATGRQLGSWVDKYTFHTVGPLAPAAPSGDGYVMNVKDPSGGVDTSSLGQQTDGDYSVECDVYCQYRPELASDGFERMGIFARDTGGVFDWTVSGVKGNNYLMTWDSDDGRLRCGKTVNAVLTDLLPTAKYLKSSGWRHMKIKAVGNGITYYLDGVEQLHIADSTFPTGKFGVGFREAFATNTNMLGARVDNFAAIEETASSSVDDWNLY